MTEFEADSPIYMGGPDKGRVLFYSSFDRWFPRSISSLNSFVIGSSWTICRRQYPNSATVIDISSIIVETINAKSFASSGNGKSLGSSSLISSLEIIWFSSLIIFVFEVMSGVCLL